MKISADNRSVSMEGIETEGNSRDFTIKADGFAFKMLSSTLYTHKIRAVIREVTCNAWDAHQDAKNTETPIEVHLPTRFEPYFEVKDYGVGLSKERVLELYSTYFESTKRKSNKAIGGFGIGSKSPFAYVDSFTVESRHGKMKRIFNAYIGETGAPSIVMMDETPFENGDKNGITIRLNVKDIDCNEFQREGANVLKFFANPSVACNQDIKPLVPTYENDFGWVYPNGSLNDGISLIMGNVVYPIPSEILNQTAEGFGKTFASLFMNYSHDYLLRFKIGELEMAPNREQLSLTKETKAALIKRLTEFVTTIRDKQQEAFRKAETIPQYFKACETYSKLLHIDRPNFKFWTKGGGVVMEDDYFTQVKDRLNDLCSTQGFEEYLLNLVEPAPQKVQFKLRTKLFGKYSKLRGSAKLYWKVSTENQHERSRYGAVKSLKFDPPVILMHYGKKETLDSKALAYRYFVMSWAKKGVPVMCVKLPIQGDKELERRFFQYIGNVPKDRIFLVSDIMQGPKPTKEELAAVGIVVKDDEEDAVLVKDTTKYYYGFPSVRYGELIFGQGYAQVDDIETKISVSKDFTTIYYIQKDEWETLSSGWNYEIKDLFQKIWDYRYAQPKRLDTIVWLGKKHAKQVKDNPRFKPFTECIKKYLEEMVNGWTYPVTDFALPQGFGRGVQSPSSYTINSKDLDNYLQVMAKMSKFNNTNYGTSLTKKVLDYGDKFGFTFDKKLLDKGQKEWDNDIKLVNDFYTKYPMLTFNLHISQENIEKVEQYIETINKLEKRKK